ncbi:MAG: serine/threonine-protein kinase [Pseudomonadota bacterium]
MISPAAAQTAGFELLEAAPGGGTSSVYKARHVPTGKLCALKLLTPNIAPQRLQREAELLGRLNHPSIVHLIEHGTIESVPYLATKWMDGCRLTDYLHHEAPLSQVSAVGIFMQLSDALRHAHKHRVVHGDISPANIIIDGDNTVTLVDFGVGHSEASHTVSVSADLAGTLRYIAPEVIQGSKATAHSDQYSLAMVCYEMLTGRWAYQGEASAASALHHHLYSEALPASEVNPSIALHICEALEKALSKDPTLRFDNLQAMEDAINAETAASAQPVRQRQHQGRQPPQAAWLAASVVAVVAVTGVLTLNNPDNNGPAAALVAQSHAGEIEFDTRCNLLAVPTLDKDGVVKNFYSDDELKDRITLRADDDQWALDIGKSDHYGLYGQIVDVQPKQQYQFAAIISRQGYLHNPALRIEWLDTDYQIQPDMLMEFTLEQAQAGKVSTPVIETPAGAHYAVPTIYKDATEGTLVVRSMVFKKADCS